MSQEAPQAAGARGKRSRLTVGMVVGGLCVAAVAIAGRYYLLNESANAESPGRSLSRPPAAPTQAVGPGRTAASSSRSGPQTGAAASPTGGQPRNLVASVNGREITRNDLANECLRHYGEEVLESLVNKHLIRQECQRQNISVTQSEVSAEIKRMAERFSLPVDHWLTMLEQERGITAKQYADDIVWPMLALRKLAGPRLEVTEEELAKHFDARYGEAVKARMIVCDNRKTAEEVRAAAAADPDEFGTLAKENSVDGPSASLKGMIQPIRKHTGPPEIEQVAFQMRDGDVSPVIPVNGQYVILKREGLQPAARVSLEQVKMSTLETLRDRKMRDVAGEIFHQLQDQAKIVIVWNDPAMRAQMPGVAAVVNGNKITLRELAEVCIERHGQEVLEGTINRRLLEEACRKRNIAITEADLDQEIARAAALALPAKPDGSPDVEKWLAMVTQEQNISEDVYRSDAVWPSVALKKLVGDKVEVTDDDLEKGYEANYGPRLRCLAIVLDDLRRAQRVWDMASSNPTPEYFGDLAAQYSSDPSSKALRGEVPPIQKHGGQLKLEEEAFSLKPGELSGIVQVGPKEYVILLCEGRTDPVHVDFATVRDEIYADIHEKTLRIAMGKHFQTLQESAAIDNYLAGSSQRPKRSAASGTSPRTAQKASPGQTSR